MLGVAEINDFELEHMTMRHEEYEAAVADFIRSSGITRCPDRVCIADQPAPAAAVRAAPERYAAPLSQSRAQQVTGLDRSFWAAKVLAGPGE